MPAPLLIATSVSTALAMGLVSTLFGALKDSLREPLHLADSRLNQLHKLLLLSWLPLMPLAGWLVDHWGLHQVLFVGGMLLSLAVSWLGICQSLLGLAGGVLGLGLAGALLITSGTALMPIALQLDDRWSLAAALGLGFALVGLAALLAPSCVRWLGRRLGTQKALLTIGLVCLVPALLVALCKNDIPDPAAPRPAESAVIDLRFWLLALATCLYFPLEQSLSVWPKPYLTEIGAGRSLARLLVGFWCTYLLCRFGLGWMIRQGNEAWLVLVLLVVSSMVLGNLAGAYAPSSGFVGVWLVAACYGPLLPSLLAIALDLGEMRGLRGQAVGILFALGAASTLIVEPVLTAFAKRRVPRATMRIPMVLGLIMAAPILVLALIRYGR